MKNEFLSSKYNLDTDFFSKKDKWDLFSKRVYGIVISIFNHEKKVESNEDDFVFKNYFENENKIENLKIRMLQAFDTQLSIGNTTLSDLYDEIF